MKAVLVFGMYTRDKGARTVDRFIPELEELGYAIDKDEADYEFLTLVEAWFKDKESIIQRLQYAFEDADIIITHSRGAKFAMAALYRMHQRLDGGRRKLFHFSPSLRCRTRVPLSVDRMYVFHTRRDWIIRLSRFLPSFGAMGAFGYKGDGPVTNIDETQDIAGHSNWFVGENAVDYPRRVHNLKEARQDEIHTDII